MTSAQWYMLWYLLLINVAVFCCFGIDKYCAKKSKSRIPEQMLIMLCVVGGSLGGLLGMFLFHHKTQHLKFLLLLPLILCAQIVLYVLF